MTHRQLRYEVIVIGGGPAGATAAANLAKRGRRVAVLEKTRFPRYHVGESLMPYCWFPLDRMGVLDKLKASAVIEKHSVQFVTPQGKISAPFYFFQHTDHDCARTWQVVRSEFDKLLLDHADQLGADVYEQTAGRTLLWNDEAVEGVEAMDAAGRELRFEAPVTIDATGRDALAIKAMDWRQRDPQLSKVSIWTYYRGGKRDEGLDAGATTVAYLPDGGWFWYIPLPDDVVSVGVVAEREYLYREGKRSPQRIFEREAALNAWIADHLAEAEQFGEFWVTGDYSYRSRYCAADGLVLAGDALAFLDPVFSSGVFLALTSGEKAALAVDAALTAGDTSAQRFEDYGHQMREALETMRKLVYAFYDQAFSFGKLIRANPEVRGDLTDCLIGNMATDFGPLFKAMAQCADLPAPLDYGGVRPRAARV